MNSIFTFNSSACYCNTEGTVGHSANNCNAVTGQCVCLENVIGRQCDHCKLNHYNISSGIGCSNCDCDSDGTHNSAESCELETGQCDCLQSRGGRTCSECSANYWGDPTQGTCKSMLLVLFIKFLNIFIFSYKILECNCDSNGSLQTQCDKLSGQCLCKTGITGFYCDRCDRGTYGVIPECHQCGECFNNWSGILGAIKVQLDTLENQAINNAVSSGFSEKYAALERHLNDIKRLLQLNNTDRKIKELQDSLTSIE